MPDTKNAAKKVDGGRWVQEVAWRDFYVCILAGFPRVSMGRPFQEKYADIVWEGPVLEGAYTDDQQGRLNPKAELPLATAESNIEKWKSGWCKSSYVVRDLIHGCRSYRVSHRRCWNEMLE